MNLAGLLLRIAGWKVDISVPEMPKCIICVAPHTSNWDFVLGKLAYAEVHRSAGFLMKKAWFFWPLGPILRAMGGIAVPRVAGGSNITQFVIDKFNSSTHLHVAITPEGTRSRVTRWRTGILHIAETANVPIALGVIDAAGKNIIVRDMFVPTGDSEADMKRLKQYYRPYQGIHPEKFTTDD